MALITITHSMGSGGMSIARKVAEALNLELYDDQRLKEQSLKMGSRAEDLKGLDEKKPGLFEQLLSSRPEVYKDLMESVVYQVSREGEGVIIGHGSQVLLRAFGCALHVLVHASESYRIQNIMKQQKLNRESAEKLIRKSDHEKAGFLRYAYSLNREDPALYDLMVHTEKLGIDAAAKLIIEAARLDEIKACSLTALETMERLSLERLVLATLAKHNLNLSLLSVEVPEKGVALIRGFTYFEADKQQTLQIVKTVPGVSEVRSEISVIPSRGND